MLLPVVLLNLLPEYELKEKSRIFLLSRHIFPTSWLIRYMRGEFPTRWGWRQL